MALESVLSACRKFVSKGSPSVYVFEITLKESGIDSESFKANLTPSIASEQLHSRSIEFVPVTHGDDDTVVRMQCTRTKWRHTRDTGNRIPIRCVKKRGERWYFGVARLVSSEEA